MLKTSYLYYYIAALLAGIALVVFNSTTSIYQIIIFTIGALVFLTSGLMLLTTIFPGKKAKKAGMKPSPFVWGSVAGGIIFGVLLMVMPGFFVDYLIYTFGILLIICGIMQITTISGGMRHLGISGWFLAMPIIAVMLGLVIIISGSQAAQSLIMILTGIALACYGINGIIDYVRRVSLKNKGITRESQATEIEAH